MITITSFNPQFLSKVRRAMNEAVRNAAAQSLGREHHSVGQAYLVNRRGRVTMRVDYQYGRSPAFQFWGRLQKPQTHLATQALKGQI